MDFLALVVGDVLTERASVRRTPAHHVSIVVRRHPADVRVVDGELAQLGDVGKRRRLGQAATGLAECLERLLLAS